MNLIYTTVIYIYTLHNRGLNRPDILRAVLSKHNVCVETIELYYADVVRSSDGTISDMCCYTLEETLLRLTDDLKQKRAAHQTVLDGEKT